MELRVHSLRILRAHKQLIVLLLWVACVGWLQWWHAQQSQQPPIYDAFSYYAKAYNFWNEIHQRHKFDPFNVEPTFRPPGTILMSYPFGFKTDFRGFYFRSIFLPIALLSLAVVISGYRRDMDSKSKWHLVQFAVFISSLPCFFDFETTPLLPAAVHWGLVDNFLAGVAALATGAAVRSIWTRSLAWLGFAAVLSSFCLLIKPAGILVMMLIGLTWLGLTVLKLKSEWQVPDKRKNNTRWLLRGVLVFTIPYLVVFASSFTSHYLSAQNLAYGNAAIVIMQSELPVSWRVLRDIAFLGLGYPFIGWLLLMVILVGKYLWGTPKCALGWPKSMLAGFSLAACVTLLFGIWFWIFGSGGTTQIRYFIPFALMTAVFALPAILSAVRAMHWLNTAILSVAMIAPVINIDMMLMQREAPIAWQKWSGVNLTSGKPDVVMDQALNFVNAVKREGGNDLTLYSISMNTADAYFSAAIQYADVSMPPLPLRSMIRPVDWQRPSTYRKREMLDADYWLFQPVRDSEVARAVQATSSIETFDQEKLLFEAWATQLTSNEGVTVVSDTPTARVLRITDINLLEPAFDALVAKHHWRDIFITANPQRNFHENEIFAALTLNPPSLENINFSNYFHLRALSVNRTGDNVTIRFWWKPLSPLSEQDWALFIHSIDNEGKIVLANTVPLRFNRSLSSLDGKFLFDQITFLNPISNGAHRLAIGVVRPNQAALIADSGRSHWDNREIIIELP